MARRRKAAEPQPTEAEQTTTQPESADQLPPDPLPTPPAPDIFDQVIAARQAALAEPAPPLATDTNVGHNAPTEVSHAAREERRMHGEVKNGVTRAQMQPNPFGEQTISLTNTNEGPKMRLYRERAQWGHMAAIQFDEKPDAEIRQKLKDGGFGWNQSDGVWKHSLGEHSGVEHRKAQELFESIANELRKQNGLEPVTSLGHGVA